MLKKIAPTLALTLATISSTQAFQPLVTDDTGTQGDRGNQFELSGTRTRTDVDTTRDLAFVYTRGLSDTLDVFVELGRQRVVAGGNTTNGPTNSAVGAKWRFYENENKTSLALKPIYVVALSTEDEANGLGTGKGSYELSLILTQEMGWGAVHANLLGGRENYRSPGLDTKVTQFSVAPVWNLNEQLKLGLDLGVTRAEAGGTTGKTRFGELGLIYSPGPDLDFALGFIREADADTDDVAKTATLGLTWRFR